jgi:hypothetical protein
MTISTLDNCSYNNPRRPGQSSRHGPTTIDTIIDREGKRELVPMRWGLVPTWWKKSLKERKLATFNARDDRRRLLCRERRRGTDRDNDIDLEPNELGRDLSGSVIASFFPAVLNRDVAALDPAEFAKVQQKGIDPLALCRTRAPAQVPDGRQLLLRRRARI